MAGGPGEFRAGRSAMRYYTKSSGRCHSPSQEDGMATTGDTIELVTALPRLGVRPADSNKGDFGRVLVMAGSTGMSGAAVLCGTAALRGGAGLVRLAVPHEILPIVAAGNPCYTTLPLPQDGHGRVLALALPDLLAEARADDVLAVGPGLGRSDDVRRLLVDLLGPLDRPAVLDADAVNAFAADPARLRPASGAARVITPHPGEFARLLHVEIPAV